MSIHATCFHFFRCKRALTQRFSAIAIFNKNDLFTSALYTSQVTPWLYFKAQKQKNLKQQCENMHQNVRQQKIKTIWRKWKSIFTSTCPN